MKIICEKCKEDLSLKVDATFEAFTPMRIECPKCKHQETRYISEADLLLYYGISEIFYVIISLTTNALINYFGFNLTMIALILVIIVVYYFMQKKLSRYLYLKAPFKAKWKDHVFDEDSPAIAKSMKWQFMLFFGIAIYYMMGDQANTFFGILMVLAVILTFIKFYLALKKEKEIINKN